MATNKNIGFFCFIGMAATMALATSHAFKSDFESALAFQKQGKLAEALEYYQGLSQRHGHVAPADLSVAEFNMGLCRLKLAKTAEQESLYLALQEIQQARACFLHAKRLQPNFERAGQRLETVAQLIRAYQRQIEQEEQAADELQAQIQALFERLQELVDAQRQLQNQIPDLSRRPAANRNRKAAAQPKAEIPLPATEVIEQWPVKQETLTQTGQAIENELSELDKLLSFEPPGQPAIQSFLNTPLRLMTQAVVRQENAKPYLLKNDQWLLARREMQTAIHLMEEILRMDASEPVHDIESLSLGDPTC